MLLIALQYWNGDRELTMRLARRMADLEDAFRADVWLELVYRFDAKPPTVAEIAYLAKKFKVTMYQGRRRATGHPYGCNELVHDLFQRYWNLHMRDKRFASTVNGVWLLEGDNVPLRKDWLTRIKAEWDAARQSGAYLLGCWHKSGLPEVGHINGNLIFRPDLAAVVKGLEGCPPDFAWDMYHAPRFKPHWAFSKEMLNLYKGTNLPKSKIYGKNGKAKASVVHGIKDDSCWDLAIEQLKG